MRKMRQTPAAGCVNVKASFMCATSRKTGRLSWRAKGAPRPALSSNSGPLGHKEAISNSHSALTHTHSGTQSTSAALQAGRPFTSTVQLSETLARRQSDWAQQDKQSILLGRRRSSTGGRPASQRKSPDRWGHNRRQNSPLELH